MSDRLGAFLCYTKVLARRCLRYYINDIDNAPGNSMQHLTVSAKWLNQAADQLDRDAEQSMQAWILLGQSDRYSTTKASARMLRRAAEIKNIVERREFLRDNGEQA